MKTPLVAELACFLINEIIGSNLETEGRGPVSYHLGAGYPRRFGAEEYTEFTVFAEDRDNVKLRRFRVSIVETTQRGE